MSLEWIDIVDTTIKIGLGALISGLTTYQVAKFNQKSDVRKNIINKKIQLLEQIIESSEKYFHYFTELNNGFISAAKNAKIPNYENKKIPEDIFSKFLDIKDDILFDRSKTIARLKILRIKKAEEQIIIFNSYLTEYRNYVIAEKKFLPEQRRILLIDLANEVKEKFYIALFEYMESVEIG